jgi:hypothetical protein
MPKLKSSSIYIHFFLNQKSLAIRAKSINCIFLQNMLSSVKVKEKVVTPK